MGFCMALFLMLQDHGHVVVDETLIDRTFPSVALQLYRVMLGEKPTWSNWGDEATGTQIFLNLLKCHILSVNGRDPDQGPDLYVQ